MNETDAVDFMSRILNLVTSENNPTNYLKRLVDFSSSKENLKLLPKYFSQINTNLAEPSSKIVFVYLKDLESNALTDSELVSSIALIDSLRKNYVTLYKELCSELVVDRHVVNVIHEDLFDPERKIKYVLKYINSKSPKHFSGFFNSWDMPGDFCEFILSLTVLVRNDFTGDIMKVIRTSEFYDVIVYMYTHLEEASSDKRPRDWFYKKSIDLITKCLCLENFDEELLLDYTDYDLEEIDVMSNKVIELKKKLKLVNVSKYEKIEKEVVNAEDETILDSFCEKTEEENKIISKAQRVEFVRTLSVLLIKDDKLNISSLPDNFRVESTRIIDSVISSPSYDVVMVLTKALSHSDFYRIKSNVRSKLVLSSSTNRGRIIDDLFYSI